MKTPEHYRPFDLASAKAGAPVGCINERNTVEILKYSERAIFGTIRYGDESEVVTTWKLDGSNDPCLQADLVMLPLGMCEGKPVFVGDMLHHEVMGSFFVPVGTVYFADCKWPRKKLEYPETKMNWSDLSDAYYPRPNGRDGNTWNSDACRKVANAAIKRAIIDGDVVPSEMLDKVANKVSEATYNAIYSVSHRIAYCDLNLDIESIINRIKSDYK